MANNLNKRLKKKVLLLVNGLGLGNSTRCFQILKKLKKENYKVKIVTSGNGINFFKKNSKIVKIKQVNYEKKNNKLSVLKLLINLPKIIKVIILNSKIINNEIKIFNPNIIISDSVYFFPNKDFYTKITIALNNSEMIIKRIFSQQIKLSIILQFIFIEIPDYLISKYMYDYIYSPSLTNDYSNNEKKSKIKRLPILSRYENIKLNNNKKKNILIMLSGSSFKTKISLRREYQKKFDFILLNYSKKFNNKFKNIKYIKKKFNNKNELNSAKIAIINGGYSAVADCINFCIPMIIMPINNHYEQWVNANIVKRNGYGIISKGNFENEIEEINNNYNYYKKKLILNKKRIKKFYFSKKKFFNF